MKTAFVTLAFLLMLISACHKERQIVLIPGKQYSIRGDIFNKGAYQPKAPVTLTDTYTGPGGVPYAHCTAAVDWPRFAAASGNGVADQTVQANQLLINSGVVIGDPSVLIWDIPQYDLTEIK